MQAFDDVETEEDLQWPWATDMSTTELADMIRRAPNKQDTENKKLRHEQPVSPSTAAHSDECEHTNLFKFRKQ